MNILLIEDDKDYAETLNDLFSNNPEYNFFWVESFEETKNAFKNTKWDIILSDVHLNFHPEIIFELHQNSNLNFETPLIFLTAERKTNLASDLIEKGDYPVISKFEIEEKIISVVRTYTDLFNLIKEQVDQDEVVSFRQFVSRYINERRYHTDSLSRSLSGWLFQEKSIFSNLSEKFRKNEKGANTDHSIFKTGFVRVKTDDFSIIDYSPGIEKLTDAEQIKGKSLKSILLNIIDVEVLYDNLHSFLKQKDNITDYFTIPAEADWVPDKFDFYIKINDKQNSDARLLDIEIINDLSNEFRRVDFINLKETNKVLVQEIHHRVNNNLNVITSLLNLRLMNSEPEETCVYQTIINQITPISSAHKLLFSTGKVSTIGLKEYLEELKNQIFNQQVDLCTIEIIEFENDRIKLNINQIMSVGLLLNEFFREMHEKIMKVHLIAKQQFNVVILKLKADNIKAVLSGVVDSTNANDDFIMTALLNKLGAFITFRSEKECIIRFKLSESKGSATNFVD